MAIYAREKQPSQSQPRPFYIASQDSCHPPIPIPPFFLVQNLSSKRVAPTDIMRPKLHDNYTHHQYLND